MPAGPGRKASTGADPLCPSRNSQSPGGDEPAVIRKEEHPDGRCQKGSDQSNNGRRKDEAGRAEGGGPGRPEGRYGHGPHDHDDATGGAETEHAQAG